MKDIYIICHELIDRKINVSVQKDCLVLNDNIARYDNDKKDTIFSYWRYISCSSFNSMYAYNEKIYKPSNIFFSYLLNIDKRNDKNIALSKNDKNEFCLNDKPICDKAADYFIETSIRLNNKN